MTSEIGLWMLVGSLLGDGVGMGESILEGGIQESCKGDLRCVWGSVITEKQD